MRGFDLVVTEGALDLVAARKMLNELGIGVASTRFLDLHGGTVFWANVRRYQQAAGHGTRILGLCDLESATCAGGLMAKHLPLPLPPGFVLRIAVRMLESWLLADASAIAGFLRVPITRLPQNPDADGHPKRTLVTLAQASRSRALRGDLVPVPGTGGLTGGNYSARMSDFIESRWSPVRARVRSASLDRALRAIEGARE